MTMIFAAVAPGFSSSQLELPGVESARLPITAEAPFETLTTKGLPHETADTCPYSLPNTLPCAITNYCQRGTKEESST